MSTGGQGDPEIEREKLRDTLVGMLKPSLDADGEIDFDAVRKNSPTLGEVLDEFALSKSARTDPRGAAKLISQALEARKPDSELAKALEDLEKELGSGPPTP